VLPQRAPDEAIGDDEDAAGKRELLSIF